jgi:hypothetical protein
MEKLVKFVIGVGLLATLTAGVTILGACTVGVVNSVVKGCMRKPECPPRHILIKKEDIEKTLEEYLKESEPPKRSKIILS